MAEQSSGTVTSLVTLPCQRSDSLGEAVLYAKDKLTYERWTCNRPALQLSHTRRDTF
jgi:hypothetical protein